jgi:hypothetical protein
MKVKIEANITRRAIAFLGKILDFFVDLTYYVVF